MFFWGEGGGISIPFGQPKKGEISCSQVLDSSTKTMFEDKLTFRFLFFSALRILVETTDDRLLLIYNQGLQMVTEVGQWFKSMCNKKKSTISRILRVYFMYMLAS